MIKYYLFKSETPIAESTFNRILTSFYEGDFALTYINSFKGYFTSDERLGILLSETLSLMNNDLGTKLVIVGAHTFNDVSELALDYAFENRSGFSYLSDVVIEMMIHHDMEIRPKVLGEFETVNRDLILTAKAYLKTGLNAKAASEMLYVHRNTFNYRLNKFIELTNLDIRDYWHAFYFNLYLHLLNR